jgi:signal transduction histidine kinase
LEYLKKVLGDDAEEYSVIFEESLREVGRIERIVSRFREAAKETDVSFADLDLAESLSRLCAFHAQGPCPVSYRGPKAHVMSGDADALKQVFTNLIRNAVEACAEQAQRKGEVCVTLKPLEGGGAEVEVADNGVGMSAETIENLFMPLYSTKERGSGLGLSVTSRLVRLHGGRVLVHSEMGRGSTFRVVFPQRKAETP